MVGAGARTGGEGRASTVTPMYACKGVITSSAPGEGMVRTGTPRETASHIVSLPLEQMTPVHFEKNSWESKSVRW